MQLSKKGNRESGCLLLFGGDMKDIEYCMHYDTCKRCPKNKECLKDYEKHDKWERKNRKEKRKIKRGYYAKDL